MKKIVLDAYKNGITKLVKILITIGILLLIFYSFDIQVTSIVSSIKYPYFILITLVIPLVILPAISSNRWKLFLKEVNIHESIFYLIKINWISIFQGLILPSSQGQDVLRIYYIEKKHPEHRGKAGSTIIIERMLGFVVLCILSLIFSCFLDIPNKKWIICIITIITLLLFFVIFLLLNKNIHKWIVGRSMKSKNRYLQKIFGYMTQIYGSITYFPYKKILFSSIILILLFQLSTICCVFLIFKAYGYDIPFSEHIAIYPIISILSMVPITISGLGIREGFFAYFYSQIGVPADVAIGVSLTNYMIIVLTPALIGSLFYLIDIFKKEKI